MRYITIGTPEYEKITKDNLKIGSFVKMKGANVKVMENGNIEDSGLDYPNYYIVSNIDFENSMFKLETINKVNNECYFFSEWGVMNAKNRKKIIGDNK